MRTTLRALGWAAGLLCVGTAWAHVPYLESTDFTHQAPFRPTSAKQSIAVYAWLESREDIDYYTFRVVQRTEFFAEVLVPVFPVYAAFRPSFALIGPGLPELGEGVKLPVTPAAGCGAVVHHDPGQTPRPTFYERFGGKSYYRGPKLERQLEPGTYALVYWDPRGGKGDYVAVIGKQEIWRTRDIRRALRITPVIRRNGELHLKQCAPPPPPAGKPRR